MLCPFYRCFLSTTIAVDDTHSHGNVSSAFAPKIHCWSLSCPQCPAKSATKSSPKLQPGDIVWDGQLKGFGARRSENFVTFVLMYRTRESRQRWYTIGKYGSPWTPDAAREEAKRLLYEVARGSDPAETKQKARHAQTVEDLCAEYMEAAANGRFRIKGGREKKPSTLASDRSRIRCHVVPILGRKSVVVRDAARLRKLHTSSRKRKWKAGASRALGMLGAIFQYAVKQKIRLDNPVRKSSDLLIAFERGV